VTIIVTLTATEMAHAEDVATQRHALGTPSRQPDSGADPLRIDLVGAMAEIAVCNHYGEDYRRWVTVMADRPGAIPDLMHRGWKVSVKGTERWKRPLHLIIPEHDTANDIYVLVSVTPDRWTCGLQGWTTRADLLSYPPEPWKWLMDRPGQKRAGALRRYVPCEHLKPCRVHDRKDQRQYA
jgi:hypothetical protein